LGLRRIATRFFFWSAMEGPGDGAQKSGRNRHPQRNVQKIKHLDSGDRAIRGVLIVTG